MGIRERSPRSLAFAAPFTTIAPPVCAAIVALLHRLYRNSGATVVIAAQAVQVTVLMASEPDTET